MATTRLNNNLALTKWKNDFLKGSILGSGYAKYMGSKPTNIFRVLGELKKGGETIVIPMAGRLSGDGVSGSTPLVGNEEQQKFWSDSIKVKLLRNATTVHKSEEIRSELDIFNAGRDALQDWSSTKLKKDITSALQSVIVKSTADTDGDTYDIAVNYTDASAAQRAAYLTNNTDRIMIGLNSAANKTTGAGNWNNTLQTLTVGNDKITAQMLHNAREMALATSDGSFGVRPTSVNDDSGEATFVYFCGPEQFADLLQDEEIKYNYRHAADLGMKNPLFTSGDRWLNGILIRRIDAIKTVGNVGASNATVARGFLCGQSAISIAYGQDPTPRKQELDYEALQGVAIEEVRGIKKTSFNGVQFGVVDVFSATTLRTF